MVPNKTIGVIVPEIKHPFFAAVLDGIDDVAFTHSLTLQIGQSKENVKREEIVIHQMLNKGIDGLLVSISEQTKNSKHFNIVHKANIPLVYFDRVLSDEHAGRVIVDDFDGAFKATEHLILSGYEFIAHLAGYRYLLNFRQRFLGYKAALEKYDLDFREEYVVWGGLSEKHGNFGVEKLMNCKDVPDAIFACNDPVAMGALEQLKKIGMRVGDNMGLVGFSDNRIVSLLDPPLTTVAQPRYEIGKTAAKMLVDHFESHNDSFKPVEIVLKTKLIIRQST